MNMARLPFHCTARGTQQACRLPPPGAVYRPSDGATPQNNLNYSSALHRRDPTPSFRRYLHSLVPSCRVDSLYLPLPNGICYGSQPPQVTAPRRDIRAERSARTSLQEDNRPKNKSATRAQTLNCKIALSTGQSPAKRPTKEPVLLETCGRSATLACPTRGGMGPNRNNDTCPTCSKGPPLPLLNEAFHPFVFKTLSYFRNLWPPYVSPLRLLLS